MGIAIPGDGPLNVKRTLGSLVPHPAAIGRVMGAKAGITAPRIKLAGGGIANAENLEENMFQPINAQSGVPDADINFITSPQLSNGPGPPKPPSSQPQKQPNTMQDIAQTGAAATTLTGAWNGLGGLGSFGTLADADDIAAGATSGSYLGGSGILGGLSSLWNLMQPAAAVAGPALLAAKGGGIPHRDDGGDVSSSLTNMLMKREAGETYHASGLLNSAGPGRTDTINTNVPTGAYVIPADIVSGLGEGNTLAGSAVIDRMFSTNPHGVKSPNIKEGRGVKIPNPPSSRPESPPTGVQPGPTVNTAAINNAGGYAKGGKTPDKAPVVVAGGEHVLSPQQIIAKFGSLKKGHRTLDHWVVLMRRKIAKEMMALPNPVGSKVKI